MDSYASTGSSIVGTNAFAYCNNNPVNMYDPSGGFPVWVLVVGAIAFVSTVFVGASMPSKEEHYSRNNQQKDIPTDAEVILDSDEWVKQDDGVNRYHRHTHGEQCKG